MLRRMNECVASFSAISGDRWSVVGILNPLHPLAAADFPGRNKQPDGSMIPYPRPNPNLRNPIQVLPMPILGGCWPTVVFEFSNENETIPQMDRDNYIAGHTGINVWIGVFYHRVNSDDRDTWWISVAVRDVGNQQNAQAKRTQPHCCRRTTNTAKWSHSSTLRGTT